MKVLDLIKELYKLPANAEVIMTDSIGLPHANLKIVPLEHDSFRLYRQDSTLVITFDPPKGFENPLRGVKEHLS
jgi:hypothetical protein